MRKRTTAVICLFLFCVLAGGSVWITSNSTAQSNGETNGDAQVSTVEAKHSNPLISINNKGRAADNGGEAEVRALADEIFTTYQFNEAPAKLGDSIKERLVRAELSYREGKTQQGISDASVVRAVNYLAYKVGAPGYARTNVYEFRRMKLALLPYTADLQKRSRAASANANDPKVPSMSPLEATVFMVLLVQQKQYNPEYQLTNHEFIELHGGKRHAKSEKQFRNEMQSRKNNSSRSDELKQIVEKKAAAMTVSEIVNLPDELMFVLGVEK